MCVVADGVRIELCVGRYHRQGCFPREVLFRRFQAYDPWAIDHFLTDDVIPSDAVILHFGREDQVQGLFIPDLQGDCGEFLDLLRSP